MTEQVRNPLRYGCLPNEATPDYVASHDFRSWLAYGLLECWPSHDDDPNTDCNFGRPFTRDDVRELRGYFLDLVETVVTAVWKKQYEPGDGDIDGDYQSLVVDDDNMLTWRVRLDKDVMMFELDCTGSDPQVIWLRYEAIEDRSKILEVLTEARATIDDQVWSELVKEV